MERVGRGCGCWVVGMGAGKGAVVVVVVVVGMEGVLGNWQMVLEKPGVCRVWIQASEVQIAIEIFDWNSSLPF